jgi:hypothetical protein
MDMDTGTDMAALRLAVDTDTDKAALRPAADMDKAALQAAVDKVALQVRAGAGECLPRKKSGQERQASKPTWSRQVVERLGLRSRSAP